MIKLSNTTSSFTWSTSEQVWPFEKDRQGRTLYCKEVDFSGLTDSSWNGLNPGLWTDRTKVFKIEGWFNMGSGTRCPIVFCNPGTSADAYQSSIYIGDAGINIFGYYNSSQSCTIRFIYAK